jgi:hypothetical protein
MAFELRQLIKLASGVMTNIFNQFGNGGLF